MTEALCSSKKGRTLLFSTCTAVTGSLLLKSAYANYPWVNPWANDPSDLGQLLGEQWVFRCWGSTRGSELFISDGTVVGTKLLKDIAPGPISSVPRSFRRAGSRYLYFVAGELPYESRLWRTDGTTPGTVPLPGDVRADVTDLSVSAGQLYFNGLDPERGREPFVASLAATTQSLGGGCGESSAGMLKANDPVIGQGVRIEVREATANRPALLVIGLKFGQLTSVLRLSGGCLVMVDITKPIVPFSMRINATGAGQLTLGVPSNPGLIGSTVMAQALVGMTSGTLGADLTAGLEMTVGR